MGMVFMERLVRLRNKVLLPLLTLLLTGCDSVPGKINASDPDLTKEKGVVYYNDTPYSGIVLTYDQSANPISEVQLENGIQQGVSRFYWPNGNLKRVANYQHGIYHGTVSMFYEDGNTYAVFNYVNGQESGLQQMWKSDGRLKANYEVINGRKYGLTGVKNCVNVLEESDHTF
jgi:antitoxin component YwqK of YwqJK toxin-antitoxin module